MSCSKLPLYILQEVPDVTESINYPIKNGQRIKYTCFDVSKSQIAFGATSGGIYVFNRNPCEFIQLIPNKDGAITKLAISSDEKHISFSNGRGVVTVTECDQSLRGSHSSVISKEHQGNEVTAMIWSNNMLFTGDDIGKISVLQMQGFIAKTMFQSSSQTIMNLDSRICQIDVKSCMLLVSTLSRCYICDTSQEQYRQIGQKLRDGEYGACFVNKETHIESTTSNNAIQDFTEVKKYNIVSDELGFAVSNDLKNTSIFCARPSSRLWEASIEGTVERTHQFKQVLGKRPMNVITVVAYENEKVCLENIEGDEGQSVNFSKIYSVNGAIFSFRKDAIYFLNVDNVDDTIWFDSYKDIVDCKVQHDMIYIWLSNGRLINLRFMKIDKFLVKCYFDEKYTLCGELCAFFSEYLHSDDVSSKLHILVGLRDKIENKELLKSIDSVIEKFDSLKMNDATQLKSGIFVMDNTYLAQTTLLDDNLESSRHSDYNFATLPPEAMQTLKGIGSSVSDKLNTSKKILMEKWDDLGGKMKNLSNDKHPVPEMIISKRISREEHIPIQDQTPIVLDNDIIYKESSQKAIEIDNNSLERDKVCKSLYQYYRLSLVGKETEESNLISTIENYACDISQIYNLMLLLEQYCLSIGAVEESKFVPNNIFLNYLNKSTKKEALLDSILRDEVLYKYFVDSCISVNIKTQKLYNLGCECGYPLPYATTNQSPVFCELIDDFIERQWSTQTRDQCYDICKKMPYLWRKILHLRRNEDLLNILRVLLQMLDETLLHSFLPQFTLDTWERTVQLYATLHANMCLNCGTKFNHMSVKETLSWDDLGRLIIKSIGGKNAIKLMEKYAYLIDTGALTMKFYHTCLVVTMFEKYDITTTCQLTDTLYSSYIFEDSRAEICNLLRTTANGKINNTALPLIIAAKSSHWGLSPIIETTSQDDNNEEIRKLPLVSIVEKLSLSNNGMVDCTLCGLPLQNKVLIKDGGIWVFHCGHTFHGACLNLNKVKLCPSCTPKIN